MTSPTEDILALIRSGGTPTPDMTCATITTTVELECYRLGLRERGALTSDAVHAIEARRKALAARGRV